VDWILLTAIFVLIVYPLLYVLAASVSGDVIAMGLSIIPKDISFVGYATVFKYPAIWSSYLNSFIYTAAGTLLSLFLTVCCAYPLSRPDFFGKRLFMGICLVTMYFSGGLIPTYLAVRDYRMLDSIWAVIIPAAMSVYNMIIMRTYFQTGIPRSLHESAQIDGCGNLFFLWRVALPLSAPVLAVVGLFYAVGSWNSYFMPMIYLSTRSKYPLSMILREILASTNMMQLGGDMNSLLLSQQLQKVMKYSLMVVSFVPILAAYPFVQRYFVKGVMIGAIKG
jgi:ABC-type glycerol-3-phosphate transport system permease component